MSSTAGAALVVAFLNTLDVETGADELADQVGWERWVEARALGVAGERSVAIALRDALRSAAGDGAAPDVTVPVALGVVDGVPRAVAHDAPGALAIAAVELVTTGAWPRLKLCAAETCRWAFVDESRNRSRSWCSMGVCGNRAKLRTFRSRAREQSD